MGYGSADHSGSRWEKSVAQSETGPVMISLRVPMGSSSTVSRTSLGKRSSTVMRGLLTKFDCALRAVRHRQASVVFPVGRHDAVAEDHPVSLLVIAEQVRRPVVTATMALTARGVDMQLHCVTPVGSVTSPAGPA